MQAIVHVAIVIGGETLYADGLELSVSGLEIFDLYYSCFISSMTK